MFLRRLYLDDFLNPKESAATYPEMPNSIKVCCICDNKEPTSGAEVLRSVKDMDKEDRTGFRCGMATILKLANSGTQLHTHFDEKSCHPTHDFVFEKKNRKIGRLRNSDIRILYFDANERILLITDVFPKHKDKLTITQKQASEAVVKRYLKATEHTVVNPRPVNEKNDHKNPQH